MYFGSVKFFKNLIATVVWGTFFLAIGFAIAFGVLFFLEKDKNEKLALEKYNAEYNINNNANISELYLKMASNGYTVNDILSFLEDYEKDDFSSYIDNAVTDRVDTQIEEYMSTIPDGYKALLETGNDYSSLYPELYVDAPSEFVMEGKTIYLTFDDGPSKYTTEIMRILDKYDIKATFFVTEADTDEQKEIMKKIVENGHTIGIHSISHDYNKIYASPEDFLEDFNATYEHIYDVTGVKPNIFRFPGGSINNYNRLVYQQIIAETVRRGFVYYDWNVSGMDAVGTPTWTSIYDNIVNTIDENSTERAIVLLHDSADKYTTTTVIEDVVVALLDMGYSFKPLDNTVKPINFSYVE